jgi:hypothetical protein
MGRLVEKLGYVPDQDPFAFTPKNPRWIDHEWLSGVVFYAIGRSFGDAGFLVFRLVIILVTFSLVLRSAKIWSHGSPPLLWVIPCVVHGVFAWRSPVRCQVFTFLFAAILLRCFVAVVKERRLLWLPLIPPMFLAWANLHGGYFLGVGLLLLGSFLAVLCRPERRVFLGALALCATSVALTAINPYGAAEYWGYTIKAIWMPRPAIEEWSAVSPFDNNGSPLVVMAIILAIGVIRRWRSLPTFQMRLQEVAPAALWLAAGFVLGFRHLRLVPLTMLLCIVFGAPYVRAFWTVIEESIPRYAEAATHVCAVVLSVAFVPVLVLGTIAFASAPFAQLSYSEYPVSAAQWLRDSGQTGRLLIDFNRGSFALWRLYPAFQISIDGRYEEVYPESTNALVAQAFRFDHPDGVKALETVNPTHILLDKEVAERRGWRSLAPEWVILKELDGFLVLGRPSSLNLMAKPSSVAAVPMWAPSF